MRSVHRWRIPFAAPRSTAVAALAVVSLLLAVAPPASTQSAAATTDIPAGLAYLAAHLDDAPVRYALEAASQAGLDGRRWPAEHPVLDAIGTATCATEDPIAHLALLRTSHAIATAGFDASRFRGDYIACVDAGFDGDQHGDPGLLNDDIWAVLALTAHGRTQENPAVDAGLQNIRLAQRPDGGWSHQSNPLLAISDTDITGMALVALAAGHGLTPGIAEAAADFLDGTLEASGGHRSASSTGAANAQSTVWALHGYHAAGRTIRAESIDFLADLQQPDGGFATAPSGASDAWATAEVLPVLMGEMMPWRAWADATLTYESQTWQDTPTLLSIEGPFEAATWSSSDGDWLGIAVTPSFATPGLRTIDVHATSDASVYRGTITVDVVNRPPTLHIDESPVADRIALWSRSFHATDPDGDAVTITWSMNGMVGSGPVSMHFDTVGIHTGIVTATDEHGARTTEPWTVTVRNLPPVFHGLSLPSVVVAEEPFSYRLDASDPDGPAPTIAWSTGDVSWIGHEGTARLPVGDHAVQIRISDADGAVILVETEVTATTAPQDADAAPPATIASVETVEAETPQQSASGRPWDRDASSDSIGTAADGSEESPAVRSTPWPNVLPPLVGAVLLARRQVQTPSSGSTACKSS